MVEEWRSFTKKGDSVWVTQFKHRSLHKYTRVTRGQDGLEIKSMIDLSGAGEEGNAAICAGCDFGERDGMRPFRPLCCTVLSKVSRSMD